MSDSKASLMPLIIADIYELAGQFRANGQDIAAAVGQTQARWQVMSAASSTPPLTVPRISRRLGVSRQNVQRIADALVQDGSARFEDNPDHRGSPCLVLTTEGRETLGRITRAAQNYHGRVARQMAPADLQKIHTGLRTLLAALADIQSR